MMRIFRDFFILVILLGPYASYAKKQKASFNLDLSTLNFAQASQVEGVNLQAETYGAYSYTGDRLSFGVSGGLFLASYPDVNFQVPELFFSYKVSDETEFSFGRKLIKDSVLLDSDWGLSLLQSSFRTEPFRPQLQGLTGVHYNYTASKFFMYGLLSPVFIPDQNNSLQMSNGEITSDNPFAYIPPGEIDLNGNRTELNYNVENDSVPDLLSAIQFGGAMGFDFDDVRVSAFYYNRPSRQLSYAIEARGSNNTGDEVVVNADVKPQFLREHFYGLQAILDWSPGFVTKHGAYGVVIDDSRLRDEPSYQTQVDDYFIFTNSIGFRVGNKGNIKASHVYFDRREIPNRNANTYIDFNKYIHGSALKLEADYKASLKLVFSGRALLDYENEGVLLESGLNYRYRKNVSLWSRLQILQDLDNQRDSGSIFERFEGLDSFRVGASFVF